MRFVNAKTILSNYTSGDGWFGENYNMNIYRGCSHGCIYCDSRSECYHVDNFDEVRAKESTLELLENELRTKRKTGVVGTGAMSDPYNPFEEKYKLTRGSLELIDKYGYGASVLTKSDLVVRDIDMFQKISRHSPAMVKLTITTYDDDMCKLIEPNVVCTSKRLEALSKVANAGIFCGVHLWPILPFINDTEDNIRQIIKGVYEAGGNFIVPLFGVTLRQNQRIYFYNQLDKYFPGIKQKYIETFRDNYECYSLKAKELNKIFEDECHKAGLICNMEDVRVAFKRNYQQEQLSMGTVLNNL